MCMSIGCLFQSEIGIKFVTAINSSQLSLVKGRNGKTLHSALHKLFAAYKFVVTMATPIIGLKLKDISIEGKLT